MFLEIVVLLFLAVLYWTGKNVSNFCFYVQTKGRALNLPSKSSQFWQLLPPLGCIPPSLFARWYIFRILRSVGCLIILYIYFVNILLIAVYVIINTVIWVWASERSIKIAFILTSMEVYDIIFTKKQSYKNFRIQQSLKEDFSVVVLVFYLFVFVLGIAGDCPKTVL